MGVEPDEFSDRDPIAFDDRRAPATGVAHTLHRDYETRSNANLPKVGVDKYAAAEDRSRTASPVMFRLSVKQREWFEDLVARAGL